MQGVTIIQTEHWEQLNRDMQSMKLLLLKLTSDVKKKDRWLNLNEAAEHMGKSYPWIFKNKHKIGCSKIGGDWMIRESSLEDFFNQTYHKDR